MARRGWVTGQYTRFCVLLKVVMPSRGVTSGFLGCVSLDAQDNGWGWPNPSWEEVPGLGSDCLMERSLWGDPEEWAVRVGTACWSPSYSPDPVQSA